MPDQTAYLSLGSNLGDRQAHLQNALAGLEQRQIRVRRQSSIYETEPQDVLQQPWFLNLVVACETWLLPLQLLKELQQIEHEVGRVREETVRRGPRVIDLDLLLYGHIVMSTLELTVPHARMTERRFVLEPLLEIAPEIRHPANGQPLRKYLDGSLGQKVHRTDLPINPH